MEVGNIGLCVYTSIRSPASNQIDTASDYCFDSLSKRLSYSWQIALLLPSMVIGAVISKSQCNIPCVFRALYAHIPNTLSTITAVNTMTEKSIAFRSMELYLSCRRLVLPSPPR